MPKAQTEQEFKDKAKEIHGTRYCYDGIKYVNSATHIDVFCIECEEYFSVTPKLHISRKQGCPHYNKEKQKERMLGNDEFIAKAKAIHEDNCSYGKTKYKGQRKKVIVTCERNPAHGDFKVIACKHIRGDCTGCPKCFHERHALERTMTPVQFFEKANKVHDFAYDYSETIYTKSYEKLLVICFHHGYFLQRASHHLDGKGCYKCGKKKAGLTNKMQTDEFVKRSQAIHTIMGKPRYNYDKTMYVGYREKLIITCSKHGDYKQIPALHLSGCGCPKCNHKCYSEKQIAWLEYIAETEGIYIQHILNDGEYQIGKYKVDGYCEETKTCYEFWGSYWHGEPGVYESHAVNKINGKTFKQLFLETIDKILYIKECGYELEDIWESQWDQLSKLQKNLEKDDIEKEINKITKKPIIKIV